MATATAEVQTSGAPTFEILPLNALRESEHNTRKHFDQAKLAELRASIERSGILTPLLVRPRPSATHGRCPPAAPRGSAGGRRRSRTRFEDVPCLVREMDDSTFLEIITIDNLQREDVHPLEEAQGYRNLLTLAEGYDIAKIAQRVGKSESYVYDRMKLLQLIPKAQKLFLDGAFTAGHAILLARLTKADQERCLAIDNENGYQNAMAGGMWQHEGPAHDPVGITDQLGLSNDDDFGGGGRLKPVSVRELQAWIDKYVRMDEAQVDRQLFPDTAAAIGEAFAEKAKVIHITRDYLVHPDAKDPTGKRTYGERSWKRADGNPEVDEFGESEESKTCDHSVLGLIVTGRGRGESFQVCIDKKRCMTHWKAEIQERNRREKEKEKESTSSSSSSKRESAGGESSWQREERLRKEAAAKSAARWEKGGQAVLEAIAAKLKKTLMHSTTESGKYLWSLLQEGVYGLSDASKQATKLGVGRGSNPGDFMRHAIMSSLILRGEPEAYGHSDNEKDLQEDLDQLKIKVNVKQLLDAANPAPKAEKPAAAKKPAKKAGKKK